MNKEQEEKNVTVQDFNSLHLEAELASQKIDQIVRKATANKELAAGEEIINELGKQYAKASRAQLAGRVAEVQHTATFNADARLKGLEDTVAVTSASNGLPHDAADIQIMSGGKVVDNAQVKYYGTAEKTVKQLSRQKYSGMQKVAPAEQVKNARHIAGKLARKNNLSRPSVAKEYNDTASRVSDRIEYGKASSQSMTRREARAMARNATKGKASLPKLEEGSMFGEIASASGSAALNGAKVAGLSTLAVSGFGNAKAWHEGRISATEAVIDTTCATAVSAIDGAAKAAVGTVVKCGAEAIIKSTGKEAAKSVMKEGMKSGASRLASSNAAFAIGTVAVDATVGVVQMCTGKISGEECVKKVGSSAATAGAVMAGGKVGAALGTMICPGVGTAVGGLIGSICGSIGGSSLFSCVFG